MKFFVLITKVLCVIFMLFLFSCESEKRDKLDINSLPDTVSFHTDIIPIFSSNCITCHNGSTPPDLTSENAYIELTGGGYINTDNPENSVLYKEINIGGAMSLHASSLNRAYVLKWIQQGANEN